MKQKLNRVTGWIVILLLFTTGCGSLRTARIRKEVTINTYQHPEFIIPRESTVAVVPSFSADTGLTGFSYTASEAAVDIMTLKLWNEGFQVIDRIFIKEILLKEEIDFTRFSVKQAVSAGMVLGADYVMMISLTDLEGDTQAIAFGPLHLVSTVDTSVLVGVNCKLVDVYAKQIVWSGAATTQDKNLQLCLRRIATKLIYTLQNEIKAPKDRTIPMIGVHY